MAKAGVLAMTQSLAVEWGPKKIRTVAISPGTFRLKAHGVRRASADAAKTSTKMPAGFASRPVCWIRAFRLGSRAARREIGLRGADHTLPTTGARCGRPLVGRPATSKL